MSAISWSNARSLLGLGLAEQCNGETDMDDAILADRGFRNIIKTDLAEDAAEVDTRHLEAVFLIDLFNPSWYSKAHSELLVDKSERVYCLPYYRTGSLLGFQSLRRNGSLSEREATVVGGHGPMYVYLKIGFPQ